MSNSHPDGAGGSSGSWQGAWTSAKQDAMLQGRQGA